MAFFTFFVEIRWKLKGRGDRRLGGLGNKPVDPRLRRLREETGVHQGHQGLRISSPFYLRRSRQDLEWLELLEWLGDEIGIPPRREIRRKGYRILKYASRVKIIWPV